MNKLLQRQIKKSLGDATAIPRELEPLLDAVSDAYDGFDADRKLVERSLDISSTELTNINATLRAEIHERRTAASELRHTVSLLTATLESTADGILVVDGEGAIKDYNQRFATLWQIPEAVLRTHDDDQAIAFVLEQLQDPNAFIAKVKELYETPTAESFDTLYFRDGRVFERYSKPQTIENDIVGRVWSFRDVTQRVIAEQEQTRLVAELEATNRELANVNQELNEFAYVVSHDLKAPLRGIRAISDWVVTDYADQLDEAGREQLRLLVSRVDRMHNLIEGILQYSRIGRSQEDIGPIELGPLLTDVIDMLAPPDHITITVAENLPVIYAERTKALQVFQNLLSNAIKYMDKPAGYIEVGCAELEGAWRFNVTDNGPGIKEQDFATIFQMFQTLGARDEYESTGVGLALVKRIVERWGGTIWVESELGRGSTFLFTLPQKQEEETDAQLQARTTC